MQQNSFTLRRAVLCVLLLHLLQQARAAPLASQVQYGSEQSPDSWGGQTVHALRRVARMTPLWRIMSSKPFGAFCHNNFECSTALCRQGRCSTSSSEPAKY